MTPDEIKAEIHTIIRQRKAGRPRLRDLELEAAHMKHELERTYLLRRAAADGTVADKEAVAADETKLLRDQSIVATTAYNYAKGVMADLDANQMALQSLLRFEMGQGA